MDPTFIKTKVVNLDRRPDRWHKFQFQAFCSNFSGFERFSAVDGQLLTRSDERLDILKNNNFRYRRGIVGASLSHYSLWKELSESVITEYYLILEDDALFFPGFKEKLDKLVLLLKTSERKYPLILLGYTTNDETLKAFIDKETVSVKQIDDETNKKLWGGTFAYIMHRSFAQKIVTDIKEEGIMYPPDTTLLTYTDDIFCSDPLLSHSPVMTYSNNADSDIQYDMLGIFDDYVFYSGVDSVGDDIEYVKGKFSEIKKKADDDDKCVAFNTFGYLKHKICHPSEFKTIPNMKSTTQGLYVKVPK